MTSHDSLFPKNQFKYLGVVGKFTHLAGSPGLFLLENWATLHQRTRCKAFLKNNKGREENIRKFTTHNKNNEKRKKKEKEKRKRNKPVVGSTQRSNKLV